MSEAVGSEMRQVADDTRERELLPGNVVPKHYHLTIEPDLNKLTYEGTVIIDLDVVEPSSSVSLHTADITINKAKLSVDGQVISSDFKLAYNESTSVSKLDFTGSAEKGSNAQLGISFTGQLNDKMRGFYRSTYKRKDGTEGILACTHMEPTAARRAFPCFDEPSLKAKFTIALVADQNLVCLSNMDVASETNTNVESGSAKKTVTFNTTPVMSTYLVAFVVGELNYVESNDFRVPVRVYAPPSEDIEHGRFAVDLAAKTLGFYEKVFGIDYPLPKMDQIAIPDFQIGAMENWGLITFRTVCLMFDEKSSGAATKESVAEVVQHELAHQWFGNLVTMDWWEGLWLKEGFATWASWYSSHIFFPEWNVWQRYVTSTLQQALSQDSLRSSHPIEVPVKRADEINQIFDAISYNKGSCVLRMISTYLGEEVFLEGIRHYLKTFAYGNAKTSDLWESLATISGKPVLAIMTPWTKRIGHPVISVTEEDDNNLHLKQNRFLRTADVKPEEDEILFPVFLGMRSKEGVEKDLILRDREMTIKLSDTAFFKLNANHTGIYRVQYSPSRLQQLGGAAKEGLLTVEDRIGIIADAGALASSGYQPTSGLLNLLTGFSSETESVVWREITNRLAGLRTAWGFEDDAVQDSLRRFTRELVSPKAHSIGWKILESDSHVEQRFKPMLFKTAGLLGDETIINAAKEIFTKYMAGDKSALHPGMRSGVFFISLKYGGSDEFDKVVDLYRSSSNSDEQWDCLTSLGHARSPELIQRTLGMITDADVKDQDALSPTFGLRGHSAGIEALWTYLTENWDKLYERFPPTSSMFGHVVSVMTSGFSTSEQLARFDQFFADKNTTGYDKSVATSRDSIQHKISWVKRDSEDVAAWITANGYN